MPYLQPANEIEAEIANVPSIKNNIIVYRHVPRSVVDDPLNSKKMFYQEKAFLSTSITKMSAINAGFECPKDDIMLKIYVPNGTTCFSCDLLDSEFKRSYHNKTWKEPYENEFLFKHGLHFALIDRPFYDPEIHGMTYPVFMVNNIKEVDLNNPLFKLGLMKLNLF